MNGVVQKVLQCIAGVTVPMRGDGNNFNCTMDVNITELRGVTFQSVVAGLPIKI